MYFRKKKEKFSKVTLTKPLLGLELMINQLKAKTNLKENYTKEQKLLT